MTDTTERPNVEHATEAAVIGAVLRNPALADTLISKLRAEDFDRPVHQQLYALILDVYQDGAEPGHLPVLQAAQRARLAHVAVYLTEMVAKSVGFEIDDPGGFEQQVGQIVGYSYRRTLAAAGMALQDLSTSDADLDLIQERARAVIDAPSTLDDGDDAVDWYASFLTELERAENPTKAAVVPVPYADLRSMLDGGFRAGEVVIVAARPAMGKTVVATEISRHAALKGYRTVFVSLEMTRTEITARLTAATANVLLTKAKRMTEERDVLSEDDWARIQRASEKIAAVAGNLTIVEPHTAFTVPSLERRLTAMDRRGEPAQLVVIDYLQLMESVGRAENRQVEVQQMSRALKLLAKKHGIPVVVLAQLNRGPEQRQDKKPLMSDLRESGAIEQDASTIILLHREDAYEKESPRAGEMDLIVAKNRNGPTGTVTVSWQGHYARAMDMARPI